ncbi:unnamed protein product [Psylliodes chrysocephalus]|uniref:ADF-H domain-containing protein n=1 Tax=Psylliodes chrysocephalus TaxID=3402493 RepID=A0A9P0GDC3_9CUCU|nr:unnamed protein product [Psylliodes chrysocephala]
MKTNLIILLCSVAYALGDEVSDAIKDIVNNHNYRYVTFTVNDSATALKVEKKGDKSESLVDFINQLTNSEPRYFIYDFEYESNGSNKQRFLGICWAPDTSSIKRKMQYSSAVNVFKSAVKDVTGLRLVYATDVFELDYNSLFHIAERI